MDFTSILCDTLLGLKIKLNQNFGQNSSVGMGNPEKFFPRRFAADPPDSGTRTLLLVMPFKFQLLSKKNLIRLLKYNKSQ
jgi:hypothetical protein